jgi:hypothetical protein
LSAGNRPLMVIPDRWANIAHGVTAGSPEEMRCVHQYQGLESARQAWERRALAWLEGSVRTDSLNVLRDAVQLIARVRHDGLARAGAGRRRPVADGAEPQHLGRHRA